MKAPLSEAELDDAEDKLRKLYAGESDGGYLPDGLLSRLIAEMRALREAARAFNSEMETIDECGPFEDYEEWPVSIGDLRRLRDLVPPA